ncbi:ATP-binding protein [Flavobacterium sp.]|uniref:ATP-binding protein n=1 Tax=Flavobacterium sp. TaxID=239 RepID=UPI00286F9A0F|nr:ATP-binding protein [Flavobacterium sp.]
MKEKELHKLLDRLLKLPKECEWVEFKMNFKSEDDIGKYVSALSNGACLQNEPYGYLVYGISDSTLQVEGTSFRPTMKKVGNDELEHWVLQRISPRIEVLIYEIIYQEKLISLFKIEATVGQPVSFNHVDYVRVGSITRTLKDFPAKEKKIWTKSNRQVFERIISLDVDTSDEIVKLLDTQSYYDLLDLPYPTNRESVIEKFISEKFIISKNGSYSITNLGALLFAKNLNDFDKLKRKAVRVIQYQGKNKITTIKDQFGTKGYAPGFQGLIKYINDILPSNEVIGQALRETVLMYPEIAIRELVANALIHQDFSETGTGPMIEIYEDRIEISNPGLPLITPDRFIDEYQSRNEDLASIMRRFRMCEEKGSGIDKVILNIELFQLPPLEVQIQEKHTKVVLYAYQKFSDMDKKDRIRACYQHCVLKYITNDKMTNQSLRERFNIAPENAAMVSRIIKETFEAKYIKEEDQDNKSKKYAKYIPRWA